MKKLFTIITLMVAIMVSNMAEAKFSDEYREKYPRRVKTTTKQLPNGQMRTTTEYKLFDREVDNGRLKLMIYFGDYIDWCYISFTSLGNNRLKTIDSLSWGDGKYNHDLKMNFSYLTGSKVRGERSFAALGTARINPTDLKDAIVINANDEVVFYSSHKRWKEWLEALNAAEKLMSEK